MDDHHGSERDLKRTPMLARHGGTYMPVIPARRPQAQGLFRLCCTVGSCLKNTKEETKKEEKENIHIKLQVFFKQWACVYMYMWRGVA